MAFVGAVGTHSFHPRVVRFRVRPASQVNCRKLVCVLLFILEFQAVLDIGSWTLASRLSAILCSTGQVLAVSYQTTIVLHAFFAAALLFPATKLKQLES